MNIGIKNLTKSFGSQQILKGVNLDLTPGVCAILGPNGSGKSTLIKSILGLVIPDNGNIKVGEENVKDGWEYRNNIGYMPQIANYPENMKVVELFSMIKDIRASNAKENELVKLFDLDNAMNKRLKELSGGMRQKVNAVMAFMFDTPILIFDEPTVGLDPVSRIRFKEKIVHEKKKGKTILLTTHHINEVEEMADSIVFILEGNIFFHGSLEDLKAQQGELDLERAIASILVSN